MFLLFVAVADENLWPLHCYLIGKPQRRSLPVFHKDVKKEERAWKQSASFLLVQYNHFYVDFVSPFSWSHLQRCRCISRNNVNSFPCCRVTLFNPHYSKHLSFRRPPSLLIPLPPSALLLSFPPPSIYSISVLRRGKFITVAAENVGETQSVHFQDKSYPHLVHLACVFTFLWSVKIWIIPPKATMFCLMLLCLPPAYWPGSGSHSVRKHFIDHLLKSFYAISPLPISLQGILSTIDSYIFFLSPSWCGSHWLPVISCRDGYYDTAGVCSRDTANRKAAPPSGGL